MKTSIGKIGKVRLKAMPGVAVLSRQPGTGAAEHLRASLKSVRRWDTDMAGYALVIWDSEMGYRSHFHTSDSPFGGTAMATFVHDALLRDWMELQR